MGSGSVVKEPLVVKSALTGFLDDEEETEQDFQLVAPDRFQPGQKHLFTQVRIYLGGKKPVFVECALSKKHVVLDVVKHVLTLYRKDKNLKEQVTFECPDTEPTGFELRQVDDDSDCSSDHSGPMVFYKPHPDFGALDGN